MTRKTQIIALPLTGEMKWLVVAKVIDTTLDTVGDVAHVCQWCNTDRSQSLLEITQHGLFGVDLYQLFMYCGHCLKATVWVYEVDTNHDEL